MLELQDLHAFHGDAAVLRGVTLSVPPGRIVSVLGRNGCGRSTLLKAVMGLLPSSGCIRWQGHELRGLPPHRIARRGLGYVPEQREVFPGLTVRQNLLLGVQAARRAVDGGWTLEGIHRLFPALLARQHVPAGRLSGGEQQMLALGRALMGNPALLLVDEPTEGLAPALVDQVAHCLQALKARGVAVLLVEQKLQLALSLSDRCCVLGHGRVVFEGTAQQLQDDTRVHAEWLAV